MTIKETIEEKFKKLSEMNISWLARTIGCDRCTLWREVKGLQVPTLKIIDLLEKKGFIQFENKMISVDLNIDKINRIKELIGVYCFENNNASEAMSILNNLNTIQGGK